MTTFTVNTDTLHALHDQLQGIQNELEGMQGTVSGYEGRLGGRVVDQALENFCSNWGDGVAIFGDNLQGTLQRLADAAKKYEDSENKITSVLPPASGKATT